MSRIVAIHQPNFFPWLGYFDKIAKADTFIFLNDVQFQKKGGTWSNRVKLLVSKQPRWVTATLDRNFHGYRKVCDMEYSAATDWRGQLLKTIQINYFRCPYYEEVLEIIEPLILNSDNNVSRFNINAIIQISKRLGIDVKKLRSSSCMPHQGSSNELLISLTRAVGGDAYMCGGGADTYQDESIFETAKIQLLRQDFQHPIYSQREVDQFIPGLSIIDVLMSCGWDRVTKLF